MYLVEKASSDSVVGTLTCSEAVLAHTKLLLARSFILYRNNSC